MSRSELGSEEHFVLPDPEDHWDNCLLSRAVGHYVLHRVPGDDDDCLGQEQLDVELHRLPDDGEDGLGRRLLDKELCQVVHWY